MYSNLPTLNIHIHIYSIKPTKYQCKIHIHIYRCILPNINVFNLPTLMTPPTHTHIEPTNIFFSFLRKNLPNINLLKLANFKNPYTYIYIQPAKYQCTQLANLKNSTYIYIHIICQISMYSTCQFLEFTYIHIHATYQIEKCMQHTNFYNPHTFI